MEKEYIIIAIGLINRHERASKMELGDKETVAICINVTFKGT